MNELINFSKRLSPFVVGVEGNISARIGDKIIIKDSGTDLTNMSLKDLTECDLDGIPTRKDSKKPSIELGFHKWLLSQNNINYVAHTHPVNTLKILCSSCVENFSQIRLFPDQIVFNGKTSCVVNYANPGIELLEEIISSVDQYTRIEGVFPKLILLKNHGIICAASTINECVIATEICEKSAEIYIGAKSLGNVNRIIINNVERLTNDKNETYRQELIRNSSFTYTL